MKPENLVEGKKYSHMGKWLSYIGKGSECDFLFEDETHSYGLSQLDIIKLPNSTNQNLSKENEHE